MSCSRRMLVTYVTAGKARETDAELCGGHLALAASNTRENTILTNLSKYSVDHCDLLGYESR